jgi:hypothetical protein
MFNNEIVTTRYRHVKLTEGGFSVFFIVWLVALTKFPEEFLRAIIKISVSSHVDLNIIFYSRFCIFLGLLKL